MGFLLADLPFSNAMAMLSANMRVCHLGHVNTKQQIMYDKIRNSLI